MLVEIRDISTCIEKKLYILLRLKRIYLQIFWLNESIYKYIHVFFWKRFLTSLQVKQWNDEAVFGKDI